MNAEFLRKNGWMLGVFAVCLVALGAGVVSLLAGGGEEKSPARSIRRPRRVPPAEQDRAREILYAAKEAAPAPTPREERLAYVEKYRCRLEEDPDNPETPVTLLALGIVYKQLQDFSNATWAFREVIDRYPTSNQNLSAWLELGTCYEFTGDQEKMISTYMEMSKVFPPDTDAHKFAQSKLKLMDIPMPGPVAEPAPEPEPGFVPDVDFESTSAVAAESVPAAETPQVDAPPAETAPAVDAPPEETLASGAGAIPAGETLSPEAAAPAAEPAAPAQ